MALRWLTNFERCQTIINVWQRLLAIYRDYVTCCARQCHACLLCFFVMHLVSCLRERREAL
ncbi:hypothetical protein EGT71_22215 [Atlantibacter subterranea]|uniref:Uncharacterized protein n=1 Tax=Atlantibacter subterraneus TaxID=255519 RepID=A0A427UNN4_9ENTR|nr:hypothetical protein EGK67_22090 [Atlantibacter subterranea]RSE04809.1 hypothetical protein EGT84_13890 [Atlantibacter subterranea]RSE21985.1 hypothetical protein EGT71_22215 [Atlantibacter subterranea]